MARIASYKKDVTLTNADKVIGTDGTTGKTVNFSFIRYFSLY